jgi:hypothetical protein
MRAAGAGGLSERSTPVKIISRRGMRFIRTASGLVPLPISGGSVSAPPAYDPYAYYNAKIEADLKAFYSTELDMLVRATSAFTQGKASLYRQDGQPKYVADEMREREAALLAALDEVLGRVTERAEEGIAEARQQLEVLKGADP